MAKKMRVPVVKSGLFRLCFRQSKGMVYCDRRKGHKGLHSWQLCRCEAGK